MFDDLVLNESWTNNEKKYLDNRLDSLMEKSVLLSNGCVIHECYTSKSPFQTLSITIPKLFPGRTRDTITIANYRFIALCIYGSFMLDKIVRHMTHCLTKGCYNPNHIELGSRSDNALDTLRDGTMGNILTEEDVLEIFNNGDELSNEELANLYGVAINTIKAIYRGDNWSRITGLENTNKEYDKEKSKQVILDNKEKYLDRIKNGIKIDKKTGCWNWTKSLSHGYGKVKMYYSNFATHVVSWSIANGRFPSKNEVTRHLCPSGANKSCCNPDHLSIGSQSDNMKDRGLFGEKVSSVKLKVKEVLEIVLLLKKESVANIAKRYNVVESTIQCIKSGQTWSTITGIIKDPNKKKNISSKLKEKEVLEIVSLLEKETISDIAERYNVGYSTIYHIKKGETWSNITGIAKRSNKKIKLREKEILEIVSLLEEKSVTYIAELYDVDKGRIRNIKNGETWGFITGIIKANTSKTKNLNLKKVANIKFILQLSIFTQSEIGSQFNLSKCVINSIYKGRTYKNIEAKLDIEGEQIFNKMKDKLKKGKENILKNKNKLSDEDIANIKSIFNLNKLAKIIEKLEQRKILQKENVIKSRDKLADENVADIKYILNLNKFTQIQIASVFDSTKKTIGRINTRQAYANVKVETKLSSNGKKMLSKLKELPEETSKTRRDKLTNNNKKIISDEDVADIKFILNLLKFTQEKIGSQYDVSRETINRIYNEKTYKDVSVTNELTKRGKKILAKLKA